MIRVSSLVLARVSHVHVARPIYVSAAFRSTSTPQPEQDTLPAGGENPIRIPNFRNTKEAYRSKQAGELVRAYTIFKMCSINLFLRHQRKLLRLSRKLFGQKIFRKVMRMTIYSQFMAGETQADVLTSVQKHHYFGIRPMLAYTAREMHGDAEGLSGDSGQDLYWQTNYDALWDAIDLAKASKVHRGETIKLTFKLTFLCAVESLRSATTLIDANTKIVDAMVARNATDAAWGRVYDCVSRCVTSDDKDGLTQVALFMGLPVPTNLRQLKWSSLVTCLAFHLALSRNAELGGLLEAMECDGISHVTMSEQEEENLLHMWTWLDKLAVRSTGNDACLVIDAEQTYLQLGIDLITLDLMRRHNRSRSVIHNTYQCYLTRTYDIIKRDLTVSNAEGFQLGAKVVRGGYMDEERRLAEEHGYIDPINPTYDATTDMYYRVAIELLNNIKDGTKLQVTFASHNEETVRYLLERMQELEITLDPNVVAFAQLMGMRDHVAFILGQAGLPANKLLHYGDVEEGVAYLSRRIDENRAGMPTAGVERNMLGQEIRRRLRALVAFKKTT